MYFLYNDNLKTGPFLGGHPYIYPKGNSLKWQQCNRTLKNYTCLASLMMCTFTSFSSIFFLELQSPIHCLLDTSTWISNRHKKLNMSNINKTYQLLSSTQLFLLLQMYSPQLSLSPQIAQTFTVAIAQAQNFKVILTLLCLKLHILYLCCPGSF